MHVSNRCSECVRLKATLPNRLELLVGMNIASHFPCCNSHIRHADSCTNPQPPLGTNSEASRRNKGRTGRYTSLSPDKRNRPQLQGGTGRNHAYDSRPDKRNRTCGGTGRYPQKFNCECAQEYLIAEDLINHVRTCDIHKEVDIPEVSFDDIKTSVEAIQKATRKGRQQVVCVVCDELLPVAEVGQKVNSTCKVILFDVLKLCPMTKDNCKSCQPPL